MFVFVIGTSLNFRFPCYIPEIGCLSLEDRLKDEKGKTQQRKKERKKQTKEKLETNKENTRKTNRQI